MSQQDGQCFRSQTVMDDGSEDDNTHLANLLQVADLILSLFESIYLTFFKFFRNLLGLTPLPFVRAHIFNH